MRILALGDVVGVKTVEYLRQALWSFRKKERIDLTVANSENASDIRGLCTRDAEALLDAGVDVITLGNHAFGIRDLYDTLDRESCIIRPANYPPSSPGNGYTVAQINGWRVLCVNVSGRVYLDPLADPFDTVDRILERERGNYDLSVMDIHAEATSEKLALAHYFDGRIDLIFGTHTHVPTADEQVLPHGTAYVTDLGMCGPLNGIIGTATEDVIARFRTMMPVHFHVADGEICAQGLICEIDCDTKKVKELKRVRF